jgi:HEPN domain-containing protein
MSSVIKEWLRKANSDWQTANLIWDSSELNYDAVCFHTQQCVEKLMKALLIKLEHCCQAA